jgi:hypothetical protein
MCGHVGIHLTPYLATAEHPMLDKLEQRLLLDGVEARPQAEETAHSG